MLLFDLIGTLSWCDVFSRKFDQVFVSENQYQFQLTGKYFIVFQD